MRDMATRFWEKVDRSGDCWEWTAIRDRGGYGRFYHTSQGRVQNEGAHRVAYRLLVGPIPEGLTLDHLCRNHGCVNPSHLEPVTRGENALRGSGPAALNRGKTHCKRGHPFDDANTIYTRRGRHCRACTAPGIMPSRIPGYRGSNDTPEKQERRRAYKLAWYHQHRRLKEPGRE